MRSGVPLLLLFALVYPNVGLAQTYLDGALVIGGSSTPPSVFPIGDGPVVQTARGTVGVSFELDATVSPDDKVIKEYTWKQVAGPAVTIADPHAALTSFTPPAAGNYVFEAMVLDVIGEVWALQRVEIAVAAAPAPKRAPVSPSPSSMPSRGVQSVSGTLPPAPNSAPLPAVPASLSNDPTSVTKSIFADPIVPASTNVATESTMATMGDPDFDALDLALLDADLAALRSAALQPVTPDDITLRGWDLRKKDEIAGSPGRVRTVRDLEQYVSAVALTDATIKRIRIKKDTVELESTEKGKLLGMIPVTMSARVTVRYDLTDPKKDVVRVRLPLWGMLVKKPYRAGALRDQIKEDIRASVITKGKDGSRRLTAGSIAHTLHVVSNAVREKRSSVQTN